MTSLYLGDVSFENFEVPSLIEFGGAQRLAVHKLIGGARIIDTLGRDDLALSWVGVLSGQNAATRARSLDTMRVDGLAQYLSWDTFCYSVVVAKLHFQFHNAWWIPYEISCVVQADLAQSITTTAVSPVEAVVSDLAEAAGFLGPAFATAISSVSGLAATGAPGQSQGLSVLSSTQSQAMGLLDASQMLLQSSELNGIVSAAGSAANISCGIGYLGRAAANLGSLEF